MTILNLKLYKDWKIKEYVGSLDRSLKNNCGSNTKSML